MSFLTLSFLLFCTVTVLVYALLPQRAKAVWLLAASWFFYLCSGPKYFVFLLFAISVSYLAGRLLEKGRRKSVVAVTAVLCFGLLFVLKYLNFSLDLLSRLLSAAGLRFESPALKLILPAGISFYLFEAVGYVIDVWRGKQAATHNFIQHALFLSFFPQLLSGPIARAPQLMPQLASLRTATWDEFRGGLFRFFYGAAKKLVIADRLSLFVNTVFAAPEQFGRLQLAGAAAAFAVQIYCDFSAYSDMAVGAAQTMGITLEENFRAPYLARSVRDFWRRWHISLSSWFRDYLYIPLGGSRRGPWRRRLNVLIVFAVSGLWHGASATVLVWGLLNGLYLVLGDLTLPARERLRSRLHVREDGKLTVFVQRLCTFLLATAAWIFFEAPGLRAAGTFFAGLFTGPWWVHASMGLSRHDYPVIALALILLLVLDIADQKKPLTERWLASPLPVRWLLALAMLLLTAVFGCYGPGFDAQSFLYFRF